MKKYGKPLVILIIISLAWHIFYEQELSSARSGTSRTSRTRTRSLVELDGGLLQQPDPLPQVELEPQLELELEPQILVEASQVREPDNTEFANTHSCAVCRANFAVNAFVPCGHRALCALCKEQIEQMDISMCVVCRTPWREIIRIYD
ncbi:hypothetical protein FQR65_LT16243 [Abscondita terminalis]|nr:hypothetical protein FQR65_LT16243 [Abscondita terminalis]